MPDPIVQITPGPYGSPFEIFSQLIDGATGVQEGVWIDVRQAKYASVSIEGTFTGLTGNIYGSNLPAMPLNQYGVTVAGTVTTNDVVTLTFTNANLPGGSASVSHTSVGGDTVTTIAAALVAAINASAALQAVGIAATNLAGVITVTYPSVYPGPLDSPSSPPFSNATTISSGVTGSATETIAVAVSAIGVSLSAFTVAALIPITTLTRWVKARVTAVSTGSANINYHATA
jgi:hypothetical protein